MRLRRFVHRPALAVGPAIVLLLVALGCSGDSESPTAPQIATPTPAASLLGSYGTQPCCCGFWTYTLTRGGDTTSWTCWGWIEIRTQAGAELTGYTNMEKDATACPDFGKCMNGSGASSGRLDSSGALSWVHGAGDSYARQVADREGCTVVSDSGELTGTLVDGTLSLSSTSTLRCGKKTAQLTIAARGSRLP